MKRLNPGAVDHDFLAAYLEHMKGVYQRALDAYAATEQLRGEDIGRIRNHLRALAMLQKTLAEHHEMAQGQAYDAGEIVFGMRSVARLIKPNGEVIPVKRKEKDQ
jgi:hypothetical protein